MAENDGFEGDHLAVTEGTSFSQLLFASDENIVGIGVEDPTTFNYTHPTQIKPPKMLCFGNINDHTDADTVVTCSDSSSVSSTTNTFSKSNDKRRNGLGQESVQTTIPSQRASKKTKSRSPTSTGNTKRKEKLGERVAALQQLVSPFGKTDTASVLHEAMGYIRFLHEQVQVLCAPYLQQRLPSSSLPVTDGGEVEEEARRGLRSKGLCLVTMDYTMHVSHVTNSNGADFWSPASMANNNNNVNSSSTKY